jgi:nucleoside-diphosphate-sugar epimerase
LKKVILFGATGFFGRAFLNKLVGWQITCVSRSESLAVNISNQLSYENFEVIKERGPFDMAIDFSSNVSVEDFSRNPRDAFLDNLDIPIKNIRLLSQVGFKGKYLYISSDRALLEASDDFYINHIKVKNDPYGASKLIAEFIVKYASSIDWLTPTVFRFPNLYGPGQTSKQLIPSILHKLRQGQTCIELASIEGTRNYLHVNDAAEALIRFLNNPVNNHDLCVSGENIELKKITDYFSILLKEINGKILIFSERGQSALRSRYISPPSNLNDLEFRNKYDWKPKIDIKSGIKQLLEGQLDAN